MTREEIVKAYHEIYVGAYDDPWFNHYLNFAIEVVRRHNEECAIIAQNTHDGDVVFAIREAKP